MKSNFKGMLFIIMAFIGTALFADTAERRDVNDLLNSALSNSDRAVRLATQNYKANETEILNLNSRVTSDLINARRIVDGSNLTFSARQLTLLQKIEANINALRDLQLLYR